MGETVLAILLAAVITAALFALAASVAASKRLPKEPIETPLQPVGTARQGPPTIDIRDRERQFTYR
jgi:hypothetical protein